MYYVCNTYAVQKFEYIYIKMIVSIFEMSDKMRGFKIPSVPPTSTKSIRFPNDIIEQVEKAIENKDCTFTAFVVEAVRVALKDLEY